VPVAALGPFVRLGLRVQRLIVCGRHTEALVLADELEHVARILGRRLQRGHGQQLPDVRADRPGAAARGTGCRDALLAAPAARGGGSTRPRRWPTRPRFWSGWVTCTRAQLYEFADEMALLALESPSGQADAIAVQRAEVSLDWHWAWNRPRTSGSA
jgi:hypothetical protein